MKLFFKKLILISLFVTPLVTSTVYAGNKHLKKSIQKINEEAPNRHDYFQPEEAYKDIKANEEASGSLWVDSYHARIYDNMYKAHRIGDSVTIIVDEKSDGFNKGDTKSDKKSEQSNGIDALGGLMQKLSAIMANFDPTQIIKGKTESKFKADASTKRSGELNARLTATVTALLRNGNMVLRGEKHIKINKEEQILIVEGIIRPYDILPDNTVLSSALADTRITYSGFGVVAERQSPGWLMRALDYVWPF